ncbi:unnamed protein product [Peniophora sp. CBMAI 1063]|nr:unnamed protein product [Peniophora sp. CBMAI 1063]
MDAKLAQLSSVAQKDKGSTYLSLLSDIFSNPTSSIAPSIHALVEHVITTDPGIIVGRQFFTELVARLTDGTVADTETRKTVIQDALSTLQSRLTTYEEQVNQLKIELAGIFEAEEEWSEAARTLKDVNLDNSRTTDEEKLQFYVRIVRLHLEDEDSVSAETYYNRAASLIHSTRDKVIVLQYKLCQARINDYNRKFIEAALRYHELSFVSDIDEEERQHMLGAAVTCAVLAPAGPSRSRVLASLYRDERSSELQTYNILSKMFLEHILRPAEVKDFEATLKQHQLAQIALSTNDRLASALGDEEEEAGTSTRRGPATVLDRAVMEHNLLASSKIYNNISFRGLGALLDLAPGAAETMARTMIAQGRLKGHIDQVDRLIWFETGREEDDAQGKAGGLGDVVQETEDTGGLLTKRWDNQIRATASHVETIMQHLLEKGLTGPGAAEVTA